MDTDVMGKKEARRLFSLYPHSTRNMFETDIDKESKKPEYNVNYLR